MQIVGFIICISRTIARHRNENNVVLSCDIIINFGLVVLPVSKRAERMLDVRKSELVQHIHIHVN